jgi:putative endopeptidase
MSEATKVKALNKLSKIVMKVGYPDKWKDLSSMKIDRKLYIQILRKISSYYVSPISNNKTGN